MRRAWWAVIGIGLGTWWWMREREETEVIDDLMSDTPSSAEPDVPDDSVMIADLLSPWRNFSRYILDATADTSISPELVVAFIHRESSGIPTARNPKRGAVGNKTHIGLMQIKCATARNPMGFRGRCEELFNPQLNILYGTGYLRYLLAIHGGELDLAIASYFVGPNDARRLRRHPDGSFADPKVQRYVQKVLDQANRIQLPTGPLT